MSVAMEPEVLPMAVASKVPITTMASEAHEGSMRPKAPLEPKPVGPKSTHRGSASVRATCCSPPNSVRSQAWINRRLQNLKPEDFHPDSIRAYTMQCLFPPPGFAHIWQVVREDNIGPALLDEASMALFFVNLSDHHQLHLLVRLLASLSYDTYDTPLLILVPHSEMPRVGDAPQTSLDMLLGLLSSGLDDVVVGEPEGFRLAGAVRSRLLHQARVRSMLSEAEFKEQKIKGLQVLVHDVIWVYLSHRLQIPLPPVDTDIAAQPMSIENWQLGRQLGMGADGTVYMVSDLEHDNAENQQVVKSLPKKRFASISGLKSLKQEVAVLKTLSSTTWAHENITKLFGMHQSETHIFFRMEFGGPKDLYKRLKSRDVTGTQLRRMSSSKSASVLSQMIAGLSHMHLGPRIAHRDIKPDNIVLTETPEDIHIKLCDFGLAKIVLDDKEYSTSICGTFPYYAPEVTLEKTHNVFASDIWSLAMTCLDVMCFARFCDHALLKKFSCKTLEEEMKCHRPMMERIRSCFTVPNFLQRILADNIRPELQCLLPCTTTFLAGMLHVRNKDRWTAKEVIKMTSDLEAFTRHADESGWCSNR